MKLPNIRREEIEELALFSILGVKHLRYHTRMLLEDKMGLKRHESGDYIWTTTREFMNDSEYEQLLRFEMELVEEIMVVAKEEEGGVLD